MPGAILYLPAPGGPPAKPLPAGATVAHVMEIRDLAAPQSKGGGPSGPFSVNNASATSAAASSAPGVVFHAKLGHDQFSVLRVGTPLAIGDVIKTSPTTVLAIHFVLGGEVGVNRGTMAVVVSERSIDAGVNPAKMMLLKGHIWANITHESTQKMLIQTNGGVMGIKG